MAFNNTPIIYLEREDFNDEGRLLVEGKFLVLFQSDQCIHCRNAKPAFIDACQEDKGDTNWATVEYSPSFRDLLPKIPDFRGFPHYVEYNDGVPTTFNGGRSKEVLLEFSNRT